MMDGPKDPFWWRKPKTIEFKYRQKCEYNSNFYEILLFFKKKKPSKYYNIKKILKAHEVGMTHLSNNNNKQYYSNNLFRYLFIIYMTSCIRQELFFRDSIW